MSLKAGRQAEQHACSRLSLLLLPSPLLRSLLAVCAWAKVAWSALLWGEPMWAILVGLGGQENLRFLAHNTVKERASRRRLREFVQA